MSNVATLKMKSEPLAKSTAEIQDKKEAAPKQADVLIKLAVADFFHTPDGVAFADIEIDGHRETHGVRSAAFRQWVARRYYQDTEGAPNSEAMQAALGILEANAKFGGECRDVFVRVAMHDGKIYLDLGDHNWCAVVVSAAGWKVIDRPPVRFRRPNGMRPLPLPLAGGRIETLKRFLNLADETEFVLVVSWLLAAMRTTGPFPLLIISGEQGSAKSTFCTLMRRLIDPNLAPLRALPREDRDLFIAANNSHVIGFDNLSGLPPWLSDLLCRLATGGGFSVRQLFTDGDEKLFSAVRPIIANGIEDVAVRPDLADRSIFLTLRAIADTDRKSEHELWAEFDQEHPRIFGALLDGVARGLRDLTAIKLDSLPRMADFALWATACETAYWLAGSFIQAYNRNRDGMVETVLDADPVAVAIRKIVSEGTTWRGTATELLNKLNATVDDAIRRDKGWPTSARVLSGRVRRLATLLRKLGIEVHDDRVGKARSLEIRAATDSPRKLSSFASPSSFPMNDHALSSDDGGDAKHEMTMKGLADQSIVTAIVTSNMMKRNANDDDDANDVDLRHQSDAMGEDF